MIHRDGITLHTPRKRETTKYGYSLFLLLGAYLLYHEGMSHMEFAFLGLLVLFALLSGFLDALSPSSRFQQWLNRWF